MADPQRLKQQQRTARLCALTKAIKSAQADMYADTSSRSMEGHRDFVTRKLTACESANNTIHGFPRILTRGALMRAILQHEAPKIDLIRYKIDAIS